MSEEKPKGICKVLTADVEKQTKCEGVLDEFGTSSRDEQAFKMALEKLSEITGLPQNEVVKRINEAKVPESPAGKGAIVSEPMPEEEVKAVSEEEPKPTEEEPVPEAEETSESE